jgi:hypothetical protein
MMNQSRCGRPGLLFTALLAVIVATSACKTNALPTPINPVDLDVLSVRDYWLQALEIAQEWHPDAYVRGVDVDVPLLARPSSVLQNYPGVRFSFYSRSEDYITFVVSCSAERCDSLEIEQGAGYPLMHCMPMSLDDFVLDSKDAVAVGLQHGGDDYMSSSTAYVVLKLHRGSPSCTGEVQWSISFAEPSGKGFDIFVDATSGEVIEIRD